MRTHIRTHIRSYIRTHSMRVAYEYTYHTHTYHTHIYIHTCTLIHTHTHIYTYAHTHMHTLTHAYTHAHTYAHTYIHTLTPFLLYRLLQTIYIQRVKKTRHSSLALRWYVTSLCQQSIGHGNIVYVVLDNTLLDSRSFMKVYLYVSIYFFFYLHRPFVILFFRCFILIYAVNINSFILIYLLNVYLFNINLNLATNNIRSVLYDIHKVLFVVQYYTNKYIVSRTLCTLYSTLYV